MTYAVALRLERGLVFAPIHEPMPASTISLSSRSCSSGDGPVNRVLVLLSSGNLAVTQAIVSLLNEHCRTNRRATDLYTAPNMYRRHVVGDAVREARRIDGEALEENGSASTCSFIFGGQINGEDRASSYLPRGQFHRGDRRYAVLPDRRAQVRQAHPRSCRAPDMRMGEAAKLILVSFELDACAPICPSICRSTCSSTSATPLTCAARSASVPMTNISGGSPMPGRRL